MRIPGLDGLDERLDTLEESLGEIVNALHALIEIQAGANTQNAEDAVALLKALNSRHNTNLKTT